MAYRKNPTDRDQSAFENQAASSGIRFPWFNGATGKGQIKTIPAYDLNPTGNDGGVGNGAARQFGSSIIGNVQNDSLPVISDPVLYPVISGTVSYNVNPKDNTLRNIVITLTGSVSGGPIKTVTTFSDDYGNFSIQVPSSWSGTVTAGDDRITFVTSTYTLSNLANSLSLVFLATSIPGEIHVSLESGSSPDVGGIYIQNQMGGIYIQNQSGIIPIAINYHRTDMAYSIFWYGIMPLAPHGNYGKMPIDVPFGSWIISTPDFSKNDCFYLNSNAMGTISGTYLSHGSFSGSVTVTQS